MTHRPRYEDKLDAEGVYTETVARSTNGDDTSYARWACNECGEHIAGNEVWLHIQRTGHKDFTTTL